MRLREKKQKVIAGPFFTFKERARSLYTQQISIVIKQKCSKWLFHVTSQWHQLPFWQLATISGRNACAVGKPVQGRSAGRVPEGTAQTYFTWMLLFFTTMVSTSPKTKVCCEIWHWSLSLTWPRWAKCDAALFWKQKGRKGWESKRRCRLFVAFRIMPFLSTHSTVFNGFG